MLIEASARKDSDIKLLNEASALVCAQHVRDYRAVAHSSVLPTLKLLESAAAQWHHCASACAQ